MTTTILTPPRRLKVFLQGKVVIPDWVDDLDSFCRWRVSGDAPEQGELAFLDTGIWVDLSREEFLTHNQVDGWVSSNVLGKKFQVQQRNDPLGHPQFFVVWAET